MQACLDLGAMTITLASMARRSGRCEDDGFVAKSEEDSAVMEVNGDVPRSDVATHGTAPQGISKRSRKIQDTVRLILRPSRNSSDWGLAGMLHSPSVRTNFNPVRMNPCGSPYSVHVTSRCNPEPYG